MINNKLFSKSLKYIPLLILIFELCYFGIPDFVKPIFIYVYSLFFGLCYLFAILQDFSKINEKSTLILRILIVINALIVLITSIYYQAILSFIFGIFMVIFFSISIFLEMNNMNLIKKKRQKF